MRSLRKYTFQVETLYIWFVILQAVEFGSVVSLQKNLIFIVGYELFSLYVHYSLFATID